MDEREARRAAARRARQRPIGARADSAKTGQDLPSSRCARELVQAARVLRRSPGLTPLSIATIGVGIGVSTILFALVNGIVLPPLPYPDPDRLVRIFDSNQAAGVDRAGAASGNIDDWRRGASSFERDRRLLRDGPDRQHRRRRRSADHRAGQRGLLCGDGCRSSARPDVHVDGSRRRGVQQRGRADRRRPGRDPLACPVAQRFGGDPAIPWAVA